MALTGLILLACAVALIVAGWRLKHRRIDVSLADDAPAPAAPVVAKGDTPTIRLGESQRIDRLHKIISLKSGEHEDLLDLTFDGIPRLRIELIGIEHVDADERVPNGRDCARIHLELGGAIAGCGTYVKEAAVNRFLVPQAAQDEQRYSILHFHGKDNVVNFLRIKVLRLNAEHGTADIDVLHVSGQWVG